MSQDNRRTSSSVCGYRWDPDVPATETCPVCGARPSEGVAPPIIKLRGPGRRWIVFAAAPFVCLFSLCLLITPFSLQNQNATPIARVTSVVRAAVPEEADLHKSRPLSATVTPSWAAMAKTAARLLVQPSVIPSRPAPTWTNTAVAFPSPLPTNTPPAATSIPVWTSESTVTPVSEEVPTPTEPRTAISAVPSTETVVPTDTPPPTDTPAPTLTSAPSATPGSVALKDANLRAGPGTNYPKVGALKAGQLLQIVRGIERVLGFKLRTGPGSVEVS